MCNGQLIDTRILAIVLLLYLPVLLTSPAVYLCACLARARYERGSWSGGL